MSAMTSTALSFPYRQIADNRGGDRRKGTKQDHSSVARDRRNSESVARELLQMRKKSLHSAQMQVVSVSSRSSEVEAAQAMARSLVQKESRGAGDTDAAMRRLEDRYDLPNRFLWSLRYRPPKGVFWHVFERLRAAYYLECVRQAEALSTEIEAIRQRGVPPAAQAYLGEAESLVREVVGPRK